MVFKIVSLAVVLSLTLIATLPTTIAQVHTATQSPPTNWSPFGPREQNLVITVYGDFQTMFNAFASGNIDITDWPLEPTSMSLCSNPDSYCTSPTGSLQLFDLEINHFTPFLGIELQSSRTPPPPTVLLPVSTAPACSVGFGQLTVHLQNQENGNATVLDSLNKLTILNQPSGSPSATVNDAGGSTPMGTYSFPCILAGTYKISSSVYDSTAPCTATTPTACVSIASGQSIVATFLVDWNSPSTKQPSQAGIYVPRALAHLVDKPAFVNGFYGTTATVDDEPVAPAQAVPNLFSDTVECADHPWFNPCNPVSAYNLAPDSIAGGSEWWAAFGSGSYSTVGNVGPGYSGAADLRAACDDLVRSGFVVVNGANSTDCGDVALASLGTVAPSNYAHLNNNGQSIQVFIRTSPGRKQFGIIIADTLNFLFGTPSSSGGGTVCFGKCPNPTPKIYTVNQLAQSCFFTDPNCWNLYTGGFDSAGTPDNLYALYYSSFASNICGGQFQTFPNNYANYCDPKFDTFAASGEFSTSLTRSTSFFAQAAATLASNGADVPGWSPVDSLVELNGWNFQQCTISSCSPTQSSIVNTLGAGTEIPYWTLLNARQVPGYSPSNSIYKPGGGDPNLIRYGFSQTTSLLSPFQASTVWEANVISQIFDSILQLNPLTGGGDAQVLDWQTTSHSSSFNPSEVSCNPINGCVTGTTTQIYHLRNDLFFQDGTPVTANDVAYTLLAYRDVPSLNYGPNVVNVASAVGLDCGSGQPCKTLQVKLQLQSPFYELDVGTVPILPEHVWEPICGPIVNNAIPSGPTSQCASLSFDPMSLGLMIGDGPWKCVVPTGFASAGHVGGPCSVNSDGTLGGQAVDVGGKFYLTRYNGFARCCPDDTSSSLYKLSWADKNNDGVVNIQDLADIAFHFGQADPYWVNSNIAPGTTVNISDLATVAFYFGAGTTYPYLPSQLTGLDPQIDPFFCPNTGC